MDSQVSPGAVGLHESITMLQKGLQPNHHHPLLVGLGYTMIYPSNGLGVSNGVQCFTGQGTLRGPPLAAPGGASAQEAVTRRVRRRIRGVSYAEGGRGGSDTGSKISSSMVHLLYVLILGSFWFLLEPWSHLFSSWNDALRICQSV